MCVCVNRNVCHCGHSKKKGEKKQVATRLSIKSQGLDLGFGQVLVCGVCLRSRISKPYKEMFP